ncbi:MAG: hypothetical protein JXR70_16835 [Spirochaetales bacterium]|nr:hypothetical protein [Spirochaetales bacterium]
MKPLNNKERNKAFFKVVGLFLIGFVIAVFLAFTTMQTPRISENESRREVEKLRKNLKFQEEIFAPNVAEVSVLLSKIPTSREQGENVEVLNQDIGALLSKTKNQVVEDESWESKMYNDVINVFSVLQLAYNEQLNMREQLGGTGELNQKLQQCINEKDKLQDQLDKYKDQINSLKAGGGGADCAQCQKDLKEARAKLKLIDLENRALKQEIEKYRKQ